jgi:hypothetical protein
VKAVVAALAAALIAFSSPAFARGSGHSGHSSSSHHSGSLSTGKSSHSATHGGSSTKATKSKAVPGVKRDANGKIHRDSKAKNDFMKQTGYPKGRPGYVVDHIVPLKKGGCDCPANMQWQTKAEAKAKDRWE